MYKFALRATNKKKMKVEEHLANDVGIERKNRVMRNNNH